MKTKTATNNKNSITKQLLLASIFIVSALFIETITFLLLGFDALPQYLLMDISILLIIAGIVFVIPSFKAQQIFYAIIIIIQIVLSYVNVTLYRIFGTVLTLDMINLFVEAANAIEGSIINRGMLFLFLFLAILYIFGNVIFSKKFNSIDLIGRGSKFKIAILIIIVFSVTQLTGFYTFKNQVQSLSEESSTYHFVGDDRSLYETLLFEAEGLKKFGTYGFYFQDINTTIFSLEKNKTARIENALNYLSEGQVAPIGEFTGVSAGNNLIVIMAESLEWFAIDEVLTPTLYSIKTQNVSMEHYYSKSKTNISEAFGFLGSYPLSQSFFSVLPGVAKLTENDFNYSLPNLLKQEGYVGNGYLINHEKNFYKRSITHSKFGFEQIYDISDFQIEDSTIKKWGDWPLDSEFFKGAIDTIIPSTTQPFFNWITTMSMHGPYDGNYRLEKYIEEMENLNWQNPFINTDIEKYYKNYLASVMDLDRAVAYLFEELEVRNLLNNTTVIIYSDHETYYHDLGIAVKAIEKQDYKNPEIYRIPFLIYDKNLPTMQINDFSCPYDIMPTIMDLLGISYNKNMYMGNSVLNSLEQTKVFWSLTGGVFNKNLFTVNGVNVTSNSQTVSPEETSQFLNEVENIINKILKFNDLYNYNLLQN